MTIYYNPPRRAGKIGPIAAITFVALYVSEAWRAIHDWERVNPRSVIPGHRLLYYKAQAVVTFDRALIDLDAARRASPEGAA